MTFTHKLRALVAGMRYAADKCDEYAVEEIDINRVAIERALARAYRADADALEKLLEEEAIRAK